MLDQLLFILLEVIAPVLAVIGLGAVVHRVRPLDVDTLVRLNIYLFVPVFLFVRIYDSQLAWREIGGIGLAVLLPMALVGAAFASLLRAFRMPGSEAAGLVLGGIFFNAGNFGIPIAELAFGSAGGEVQALIVMFMNTAIFFLGYLILSLGKGGGRQAILGYFRLPMIYVIAAAFLLRETGSELPAWLGSASRMVAGGMLPLALVTLGVQISHRPRWPRWGRIVPVMFVKLAALPVVTAGVCWLLGLWPWPAAQLILASAGPTAVNTLLLTIEIKGDADTAADCVFWTTLAAGVTITATLGILLALGAGPPVSP